MATRNYDYGDDESVLYLYPCCSLPAAGQSAAKSNKHQWKHISLGKQHDHAEPDWPYGPKDFSGHETSRSADHHSRMDPNRLAKSAGATSRACMREEQMRIHVEWPRDHWEQTIGRARRREIGERGGRGVTAPIELMQHKAKGEYNKDGHHTDPIAHCDEPDWKFFEKPRCKKHVTCDLDRGNPILHSNEPDDKYYVKACGKKHLPGGALGQDVVPPRQTIRANDRTFLHKCCRQGQWDQIDGPDEPKMLLTFESRNIKDIMDRGSLDYTPGRKQQKEVRRSRSVDVNKCSSHSSQVPIDLSKVKLSPQRRSPRSGVSSIAPSDSISQISGKQRTRSKESLHRSQSARNYSGLMQGGSQEKVKSSTCMTGGRQSVLSDRSRNSCRGQRRT